MKPSYRFLSFLVLPFIAGPWLATGQERIYIDPGHGGSDPGAVNGSFGTKEADRVLFTALALRDYMEEDTEDTRGGGEWEVRLSRETDVFISLGARSADANGWDADRFLSIHQNAFNASANGTETFSLSGSGTSARLRNLVQAEAIQAWGLVNRGNKTANFSVLRNTAMPAVLTEMGFIDSSKDHPFCSSDEKCDEFAKHMLFAFQQHYDLDEYLPGDEPVSPGGIVVDNGDASGFSESGTWSTSTSAGFFGANSRFAAVANQSPNNTATFVPNLSQPGRYEVYAWWVPGGNRSPGAGFVVNDLTGSSVVKVDQRTSGNQWNLLGTFNFQSGREGNVVLTSGQSLLSSVNPSSTVIMADSVRFVRVGDLDIQEVIVDNSDLGFRASGRSWFRAAWTSGFLGDDYHARPTAYTSDPATWSASLPVPGQWEVFARWTTGGNRSQTAPYIIQHTGGTTTRSVNQRQNNATWVSLGTYNFAAGYSQRVQLSCWTFPGDFVVADAVKFIKR